MAMCLSGFYYSIFDPNKRNTLALMKALMEWDRDPCHCPECDQIGISLAAILGPHTTTVSALPIPTGGVH